MSIFSIFTFVKNDELSTKNLKLSSCKDLLSILKSPLIFLYSLFSNRSILELLIEKFKKSSNWFKLFSSKSKTLDLLSNISLRLFKFKFLISRRVLTELPDFKKSIVSKFWIKKSPFLTVIFSKS